MKLARTAIAYCGLLASVLVSHALGGGRFLSIPAIFVFSILIVGALSISMPEKLEGPHLALLVLVAQILGHFIFGGGEVDPSMGTSHIIGGLVGFRLVISFDQLICGLENLARRIFIPLTIKNFVISDAALKVAFYNQIVRVKEFFFAATYSLRAPPRYIVN